MKQTPNLWLSSKAGRPGILAGAVHYPDKTMFSQIWSTDYTAASWESACRRIVGFLAVLRQQRLPEQQLCWFFENHCLGVFCRAEGISLFCLGSKQESSEPPPAVKSVLEEFSRLSLDGF